jgi:catechol 2,3-dioxygenase-like lactoylglutathione lyase family enzyme
MPRKGLVLGLEWVESRVPNYEEMKKFYRNVLHLPLNFEEDRKDFIQFKVAGSKTYLALLDTKKTGVRPSSGYIPTVEVSNLDKFTKEMKKKGVRFGKRTIEGDDVRLIDFYDPNGRLLQAFQFKHKPR